MPPEQATGKRGNVGRRSDVYALGAILYHVLTGRPPFVGEGLAETVQQVLNVEPVSPRVLNPSVPADLETICLKCLEKEPGKRYATAQMLAEELGRFLEGNRSWPGPLAPAGKVWRWCRRKPRVAGHGAWPCSQLLLGLCRRDLAVAPRRNCNASGPKRVNGRPAQRGYIAEINSAQQALEGEQPGSRAGVVGSPPARVLLGQWSTLNSQ